MRRRPRSFLFSLIVLINSITSFTSWGLLKELNKTEWKRYRNTFGGSFEFSPICRGIESPSACRQLLQPPLYGEELCKQALMRGSDIPLELHSFAFLTEQAKGRTELPPSGIASARSCKKKVTDKYIKNNNKSGTPKLFLELAETVGTHWHLTDSHTRIKTGFRLKNPPHKQKQLMLAFL